MRGTRPRDRGVETGGGDGSEVASVMEKQCKKQN